MSIHAERKHFGRTDDTARVQSTLSLPRQFSQLEEQAKLPCVILPPIRTSRFFDRADVTEKIEEII